MTLSDKMVEDGGFLFLSRKDVKEFIRQERELLQLVIDLKITWLDFLKKREELAGEKLI